MKCVSVIKKDDYLKKQAAKIFEWNLLLTTLDTLAETEKPSAHVAKTGIVLSESEKKRNR